MTQNEKGSYYSSHLPSRTMWEDHSKQIGESRPQVLAF